MPSFNHNDTSDFFEEETKRLNEKQELIMDVMERRDKIKKLERPEFSGSEDISLDEYIKQKALKDAQIDKEMAKRQKQ